MSDYGVDLRPLFIVALFVIAALLIGTLWGGYVIFKPKSITSNHRIEPELKLTIKHNKVDTLFIYKEPKR